ncbi:hypothetical protein [Lentzea flava]|nr:hypothetical protein [Lentzea flava]
MKSLVTENYAPDTATTVSEAWKAIGNTFKELATDFSILVNGSQDGWKGRAAEGVRTALGKVGTFADQTGDGFLKTSSAIEQQREAAVQANKSMPDPVEFNPMKIAGDWLTNKGGFIAPAMMVGAPIEMISTYNKQQGAKEEAVQVMQTRDNTMMAAAMSMPTMESTPQVTQDQGVTQTSSSTSTHSLSNSNGYRPPGTTGMPGMPPPPGTNNGTTNPSWVPPQTKDPNLPGNYDPNRPPGNQNRPPGIPTPGPFPPGRIPPGGGGQGRPPGGGQGRPAPGGGGMRGGAPGGGAGGRGMGPGGMSGVGGRGMGSFGPANPGGGAGVMGSGPGGAAGAGAAGGRAGAAGAAGMGGGAGAGHGGGEEDKEHKSNYLVPTDEFFDDDRMVAPPVIGG